MAGTSMNDIKARMKSVESTMQITKAMELVATSKLRRAKENVEKTRPFYRVLGEGIENILSSSELKNSIFTEKRATEKTLYLVIAGDRGLAGGYNANIFRLIESQNPSSDAKYLPIGRKAIEYYTHRNRDIISKNYEYVGEMTVGDAMTIGANIVQGYLNHDYDKVVLVYTRFVSMMTQLPISEQLLPLAEIDSNGDTNCEVESGVEPEELLMKIVPQYLGGVIHTAICESLASESGARRSAMNSANKNASEMIDGLKLSFNRARQAAITQEITEIVSGAEAL